MNIKEHWFWWVLTVACILWYSTITIYVAVKGAADIKNMLARLQDLKKEAEPPINPVETRRIGS